MKPRLVAATLAILTTMATNTPAADPPRYERRWFYAMMNLQVPEQADTLNGLIGRARAAGYNGLVLADYKLNILDRVPDHYFKNVARVRLAAERAGLEIIPAVFPIGYSNGLLAHDPNLAEGLPVVAAPFVAQGRSAVPVPDPATRLANGGLEETRGDQFVGFSFQDDPGKATVADREVVHGGKVSCRMRETDKTSSSGNSRLIRRVQVRPHACYRFSCWAKTQDLAAPGNFHLTVIGAAEGARPLTFFEGGLDASQDWRRMSVVFNSLDQSAVNLYVGLWGGSRGTLWIDDMALEELALVNVLRRNGCPLDVTSVDGRTRFEEGRDFETVRDPKLGQSPYAGEFEFDHDGPPLKLTRGSRIKDGDRLRVSWYHPILTHGSQIACCLSEPKVFDALRDQARRVVELLHPRTFFMSHDELRVANWCRTCQARHQTPGQLLAANARRCTEIIQEVAPGAEVVVWSDMFDPNHNAVANYYLVNGTLDGSWKGLDRSVIVANWNSGKAEKSLKFFDERGHRQVIAGYYDDGLDSFKHWDAAARGVPGVVGFLYTTWAHKFDDLEAYGRALRR